jgi:hypothetical protein
MSDRRRSIFTNAAVSLIAGAAICTVILLSQSTPSYAIPAFSRKYQTSCSTCHNNYPELNDFGLAFKKNGFKFPKDDDSFVKQPPVLLGAKAQKEAFPEAIYPGEIPGQLPIAFRYSGNFAWNANQPAPLQASQFAPRTDLFAPTPLRSSARVVLGKIWPSGLTTTSQQAVRVRAEDWGTRISATTISATFSVCP